MVFALATAMMVAGVTAGAATVAGETKTIDLGGEMKIEIPGEWHLERFGNQPAVLPSTPKPGIAMYGWRGETGTTRIDITYMALPGVGAMRKPDPDGSARKASLARGMAAYLRMARETAAEPTAFTNGGVLGAYVSLHAKDGAAFDAFPAHPARCVTAASASHGDAVVSITLVSPDCDSDEHRAAVAAAIKIHD